MKPREAIEYLKLIEAYLYNDWLNTQDKTTKAEIEQIAASIAELSEQC